MTPQTRRQIERVQSLQSALRRRGDWERWQEKMMRIASTPARTPEERIARKQALAELEAKQPQHIGHRARSLPD